MRFTKPAWVMHQDGTRSENAKRLSIFSVHVHPDGSRIASGGLDAKIRIWSTKPILNQAAEMANKPPKSLCTLTMHTGPVLTVRWAHSGRWLASGSDDAIIMIWDLDPTGSGKVWGSDEYNVEGWKPLKRLPGHESDVTDLAWAPEDRFLASTGLDSKVLIWCGYTLDCLSRLDLHQGFVKGVCWDPAGEFLATQSDDRTVRIWRTTDWGIEATITKPFEHSPGSTFFRRLSWSPDGAHITASNATNNNGYVFTAAVISRSSWTSDISLVGHENTVEVASYNPHIFLRDPTSSVIAANICSVVALGADDRSISVWQTKSARPLVVAKEVFERQIMDLSWSSDGLTLYAVSSDGTLAVFAFDKSELEGIAPPDAQRQYLSKFGFVPSPLPNGYSHVRHETNGLINGRSTPPLTPPSAHQGGFGQAQPNNHGEQITTLIARRGPRRRDRDNTRRRVQPSFEGTLAGPASSSRRLSMNLNTNVPDFLPPPLSSTSGNSEIHKAMDIDSEFGMDMTVPINALDTRGTKRGRGDGQTMSVAFGEDGNKPPKARTLGGDRVYGSGITDVHEIRRVKNEVGGSLHLQGIDTGNVSPFMNGPVGAGVLPVPTLKNFLEARVEETGDILEARNSEDGSEHSEVSFFTSKEKTAQWLDYLPSPALKICASSKFCAVAMDDGSVNVYSMTGRRIMPTMTLGRSISFLDAANHFLMAITSSGQVFIWNTKTSSALHAPASLLPLLVSSPPSPDKPNGESPFILSAVVRPNGSPLIHLSSGSYLSYDSKLLSWVRVCESWWANGSSAWKGRQRNVTLTSGNGFGNGIISSMEARMAEFANVDNGKMRPHWWEIAMTLGHLEARMHSAKVLESPQEYRQALLLYAKTIADERFRGKAEELLKDLYGPVYCRPGRSDDAWSPTILGMAKRDLVKEVISIFTRSKTFTKLAQDYQDLLRKSIADE